MAGGIRFEYISSTGRRFSLLSPPARIPWSIYVRTAECAGPPRHVKKSAKLRPAIFSENKRCLFEAVNISRAEKLGMKEEDFKTFQINNNLL